MTVIENFQVPESVQDLPLPDNLNARFYILFLASNDPATGQPWCSDVRAALPVLNETFTDTQRPAVHYAYVGVKEEYKGVPSNRFRTDWNINNIPALVRYQRVDGKVQETARLKEEELLDIKRIQQLIES